ncbi:S-layer homology domain-containing protein [Sporosarcina sp. HYO08]|uniref:S-layer homology domain-containing protein n=1 Tax=Sporosarcina sp. HYO08 TaxID=1759557 RepID=UPI00079C58AA|nr:S-layer homology domain-containing protein [Sporosarcina sp. HYO08]KXH83758.1 alkaline phosphatase [Sporosarcina sp. HYO08]
MKTAKLLMAAAVTTSIVAPAVTPVEAAAPETSIKSMSFTGMEAPKTIDEMVQVYSNASLTITYTDGATKNFPLSYKELYKTEDQLINQGGEKFAAGTPVDVNGKPISDTSATGQAIHYLSDAPDANSLLRPINGELYLVSHLEYATQDQAGDSAWRRVPASMTLTKLYQNKKTGELKVMDASKVDFSDADGLWVPCNGSLTPWNTHLGSEEYEPDARQFELEEAMPADQRTDKTHTREFTKLYFGDDQEANPYRYGFIPEVIVDEKGESHVVKHYSTGRRSNEVMLMMPDNRTAFFGDDGDYTMLFMYVADKEKDLSAGTLYAAKFDQIGTANGGSGDLSWIKLGHSTDDEIKALVDQNLKFSDIFETADAPKEGFTAVKQYSSGGGDYDRVEYLKVKPGMEKAAAFLESRRYGAMLGATSEFNKMEGLALNAQDKKVYMAIADQSRGMEKDTKGEDPTDHIQLPKMKSGATYELVLTAGQKDQSGATIASPYVAASMNGLVIGEDLKEADAYGNTANVDKVANPDNLSYSEELRTVFIGEDSGMHTNNYVWAYELDSKKLSRILSVPAGAEATGLQYVDDRNGFSYIMSNFQHPGDEVADRAITAVDKDQLVNALQDSPYGILKTGAVGYIHGLPTAKEVSPMNFKDVAASHWAHVYIADLYNQNILKGVSADQFLPNRPITRHQFAAVLVRGLDLSGKNEVQAAIDNGLVKTNKDGVLSRQEATWMLMNAFKLKTGEDTNSSTPHFKDAKQIDKEYQSAVAAGVEMGLISGDKNGKFNPKQPLTRAEAAKVVSLMLQK